MLTDFAHLLPAVFGVAAVVYLFMAVRVARASAQAANSAISFFLLLIGSLVAGAAFWYQASDMTMFRVGRVLTTLSAGFIPVVLYRLYREYSGSPPAGWVMAGLCIIPAVTTGLAVTNPVHGLLWQAETVDGIVRFSLPDEAGWYRFVYMPFSYGLFGYSLLALGGRLWSMPRAHRSRVMLLLVCAVLPFAVSAANVLFDVGPFEFPFTASSLVLLIPLYWWASVRLRAAEFKPIAYQTLFDHVRDAIVVLDASRRIVSANRRAQEMLKQAESALVGRYLWDEIDGIRDLIDGPCGDGDAMRTIRTGEGVCLDVTVAPLTGADGVSSGVIVVCRDVTERRKTLRALADSEQLIRSLVEHSSNGMLRFARSDSGFLCTFANRAAQRFLGCDGDSLVGRPLDELTVLGPEMLCERFDDTAEDSLRSGSVECEIQTGNGECWLRLVAEPIGNDFSVTLIDVTERKKHESKILADALHDSLTGVLNRRGFEATAASTFDAHVSGAVLYLDLDDFKAVNDRYGHEAGDALLKAFAHRLEFCLRPEDRIARLGGDEFAIVLPGVPVADAEHVARRVRQSAAEPYLIHAREIVCPASIGLAFKPRDGRGLADLVRLADLAMYADKTGARGEDPAPLATGTVGTH